MSELKLIRRLSTTQLTFYGIGTMLGAGIYMLVGKVAGIAGLYAPVAFLFSALLAAFSAFSYARLSARFPKSAGEVVFVQEATGVKALSSFTGWMIIFTGIVSTASILNGFVGYLDVFIQIPPSVTIIVLVIIMGLIASWGIGESMSVIAIITVLEMGGLIFVVFMMREHLTKIDDKLDLLIPPLNFENLKAISLGAFLAFYAFVGFEDLANVAEEAKDPQRSLPRAYLYSMIVASLLYFLVALVAVLALPIDELAASDAPLASILAQKGSQYRVIISGISLIAVVNGALAQVIMASRVVYGMADQGNAPSLFKRLHPRFRTPVLATIFICLFVVILALWFPIVPLAEATSFIVITVFALVNLSLVILELKRKNRSWQESSLLVIPILGFILCLTFLIVKMIYLF